MTVNILVVCVLLQVAAADQSFGGFQHGSFFDGNFAELSSHSSSGSSGSSYQSTSYKPTKPPVYKPAPAPAPTYHSAPAPSYAPAPAPAYAPAPQPSYHKPEPAYQPEPSYGPSHNCSVQDEVVHAEVCTPGLNVECGPVTLKGTKIGSRQKCVDITRTVCSEGVEEGMVEVCQIKYETKPAKADATVPDVSFERMCDKQMVTVCKPQTHGYGYNKATYQHCEEIAQETCFNKPIVKAVPTQVDVRLPEPKTECGPMRVMLPTVQCEEITEQSCVTLPALEPADVQAEQYLLYDPNINPYFSCVTLPALEPADVQAEQCTVNLDKPECKPVQLVLPKQVCQEILYGHAHKAKHTSGGYN